MEVLTVKNLIITLIVLMALAEGFNLALKTAQNIKALKKPNDDMAKVVGEHSALLVKDKKRLDSMEEGQKVLCTAILALLNHEITGNSVDKLKQAKDALTDYLISK